MSQTNWEADKMLDVYIYDYLMKRKLHATAKAFQAEGKVSTDPVAIDAPGGFLFEWWSVFWDIFISRTNEKHSESATSYIQTQVSKVRELQKKQQQEPQNPQQHQQMQMQLLMQRHAQQQQQQQQHQQQHQQQQQRRDGTQLVNASSSSLVGDDPMMRQTHGTANSVAAKMYEERLKLPAQKDAMDDATKRAGENVSQLLDHSNHASLLTAAAGQPPGQTLIGRGISGNLQQLQNRNQPHSGSTVVDLKNEMNPVASPHTNGSEGSVIGVHGSNQGSGNITLKGWPLTGFEQLRCLQQKTLTQSPQSFNQIQLQQQLMLRAQQQSLASSSANELECRKIRMLLNNPTVAGAKDGLLSSVGDLVPNMGSPMQAGCSVLPTDSDVLLKLHLQQNSQQQQQFSQHPLSSQQSQNHLQQTEKIIAGGTMSADGNLSNTFQGNDQASKNQIGRKRKQAVSSSGPANSSGTANTVGPSPCSPSTPSTHTPGDAMSIPTLQQNASSKSLLMFGSDGLGSLSAQNQMADMDRFVGDGSLDDNIDSFLSPDGGDPRDGVGNCQDMGKGFTFKEFQLISASTSKVECCDFSSDGKLLATGGHDRKVSLWCTESFTLKSNLEEHSQWITDVRFSPSMSRLATSSADRTVRIWDTDNPGYSLRTFAGHSTTVMSLDFHPSKEDLVFSCDNNNEIIYWSIEHGTCAGGFKGGATQMRFQPRHGRLLAAAMENLISILDVETLACRLKLQGHKNLVHSVCWDSSGDYLASLSDEMVRIWTVGSGSKGESVHELNSAGNKFNTCAFHPSNPSILVIGCYETLELWNFVENKTMTIHAHDKLVSSLAVSNVSGIVASASHDKCVKLWK